MTADSTRGTGRRITPDFWLFWGGQSISQLGSSFTLFALPLLVFKLTGSAVSLALATAFDMAPYLLFGLVIGAWVDRLNRKRMMIAVDVARALVIALIPFLAFLNVLTVWWIYAVGFATSTLTIFFEAGEFAAIPSLVSGDQLVTANGRIQASYNATRVAGPLLAGALIAFVPLTGLFLVDAGTFIASAMALSAIGRSFNAEDAPKATGTIRQDVMEGLRYVFRHPVLRNISAMMAFINFVYASVYAQLVLFAKVRLEATDSQVGLLFAAGSLGAVAFSWSAGALRKRYAFSTVALGALLGYGLMTTAMAMARVYWLALGAWLLAEGVGSLFNINTGSLRQQIVPNHMLGRIMSIAGVLAWSAIPLGSILGGFLIRWTHNVALVFAGIGVIVAAAALSFWIFSPLGHAEDYMPGGRLAVDEPTPPVTPPPVTEPPLAVPPPA